MICRVICNAPVVGYTYDDSHPLSGYNLRPLSSYGQSQLVDDSGDLQKDTTTTTFSRIFTIALHAAVTAKLPLESVIMDYEMGTNEIPLDLPSPEWFDPSDCSLKKLLHLQLCITRYAYSREPDWADTVDNIMQFFILAPNIDRLGLNLGFRRSASLFLDYLVDTLDFGNITTLDLKWVYTSPDNIINVFARLPSKISCLNLCGLKIDCGDITDIFKFIRDKMQLKKISGQDICGDYFGIAFENGPDFSHCFRYEGPDMKNFMNDLISSVVIM